MCPTLVPVSFCAKLPLELQFSFGLYFELYSCQVESTHGEFVVRELSAVAGAITITCLMVCILYLIKAYTIQK